MRRNCLALAVLIGLTSVYIASTGPTSARGARSSTGKIQSDDPGCRASVARAASLFASGNSLEAANLLTEWSSRCPHNAQLHLLLSTVLLRLGGRMSEAMAEASRAVAANPDSVAAHLQFGLLLLAGDNTVRATQEFEQVVELDPSNYEAWSSLSSAYAKLHEDEKAQQCANKAADLEPSTKTVRLRMLRNLEHAGKLPEAKAELKRLVTAGGFSPEFLQQLADEAMSLGAWEEALLAGGKVAEAYPKATAPLKIIALAQFNSHAYQDCLATTRRMLTLDPNSPEGLALKGRTLIKLGSADEGEKELKTVLARQPELPLALVGQGELAFSRGDYARASEDLMHALDADPALGKTPEVFYALAQALEKQGDKDNSLLYYKKSLAQGLSGAEADEAKQAIVRLGANAITPSK